MTTLPAGAIAALHEGRKIEAIKIVREARGLGLKESKALVEAYLRTQPALQASVDASQAAGARQVLGWLVAIAALGAVAVYFLR